MPSLGALLPMLLAAPLAAQVAVPSGPPPAGIVERVLAVVDGRPLLLSDVRALQRARGVSEEAALELLVDESLMYDQASRTPQAAVTPEEEQGARAELALQSPGLAAQVAEAALARLLRRQLAILKYVDFRFRPQVRPSDEDLLRAYAELYQGREGAPAFETVSEALRERVTREQLGERVEAWVRELRADAEVRHVGPPG
ncbi:MAG TPA: hypothetical protein VI589_05860 [Vicinamibacteria bacterium]